MLAINDIILKTTDASAISRTEIVQTLWSGYGEVKRYEMSGGRYPSVIVKHIQLPEESQHPKGWNTNLSHQRKLKSYQVERNWYQQYANETDHLCRVPKCYHTEEEGSELLLIMEDLDTSGFPHRLTPEKVTIAQAKDCLTWLAHFHAEFMGVEPDGLWPVGTYWHLKTRPDEWDRMQNLFLKNAAKDIDEHLNKAEYQTFVHGDAKLANFCFSNTDSVAAVDFQYVGKGCGMKDVAYFISSCFDEADCEKYEEELLNYYFKKLGIGLDKDIDYHKVKEEWSELYKYAWADLYRFLDGWSPGHWKMHGYSKRIMQQVITQLTYKHDA
ncbi:MAG: phosphotransferase [Candidatus Cyclobacteriaceae bacterium M2_1C_046]